MHLPAQIRYPMPENTDNRNKKPLVSIVTITFNSERFLEQTFQSVMGQDYPNIEYVIVDGGSTDGTVDIIKKHEDRIAKWVSEPDDGISDAMNKGITMSTGEIIGMIHSDDYYADPTVIGRVVEGFSISDDIKLLYGVQDYVHPETGEVYFSWGRKTDPSEIKKHMYLPHPTVFCRREVYEKAGLFRTDYRYAMDYEWAMRVIEMTDPHFLDYRIAVMRDMGHSGKNFRSTLGETSRALREHGYYGALLINMLRNFVKLFLERVGLKDIIFRVWVGNIRSGQ